MTTTKANSKRRGQGKKKNKTNNQFNQQQQQHIQTDTTGNTVDQQDQLSVTTTSTSTTNNETPSASSDNDIDNSSVAASSLSNSDSTPSQSSQGSTSLPEPSSAPVASAPPAPFAFNYLAAVESDTATATKAETPFLLTDEEKSRIAFSKKKTASANMATASSQQVFIDGSFEDLSLELADYIDAANSNTAVHEDIAPLFATNQKDEVLKKLVAASPALNASPEKEFTSAYNLLIYLLIQSPNVNSMLQKVCENLSRPITSSPQNGPGLALGVMSTLFNLLPTENDVRPNVFSSILRLVKQSGSYDVLKPGLAKLDQWVQEWDYDGEDQRKLYAQIADVAEDAGEDEDSYQYILRALKTFTADDSSSQEAQDLSIRALKSALVSTTHYDFSDLTGLSAIQALSESHPVYFELLEIFNEKELEDYNDFNDEHEDFLDEIKIDGGKLHRKMRLLTLCSLAASTNSKELEYKRIAKALQIPSEDVEMWVIDVIRGGLVEGKLSQQKQMFLIHSTTYRVFGEKQWRQIANKIDVMKESLNRVLDVIRAERQAAEKAKEQEMKDADRKANGAQGMGAGRKYAGTRRGDDLVEMGTD